ncbi:hypothetical protein AJ80_01625 [Polytolypa hystricis UAMH7299]|uniref:Uncharacterized protein n=1 Tax=Polytolypa hystricis (strain UAMH7299) TaxID=1447883 RepID=A0A2B7Z0B4_POLH7|nr:hypothetical protein AJ80_01625 [Polytolypa hystricis UAMH7299]
MDQLPAQPSEKIANAMGALDEAVAGNLNALPSAEKNELCAQAKSIVLSYEPNSRVFYKNVKSFLDGNTVPISQVPDGLAAMRSKVNASGSINSKANGSSQRHLEDLQTLMKMYQIRPKAEDFMDTPISLADKVTIPGPEHVPEPLRNILEKKIALKEEEANYMAYKYAQKYGDSPLIRAAFREYYTTGLLSIQETCWRPDPRGQSIRIHAQDICSQAIDENPWLNTAEMRVLIRATGCFPQDAMSFWRWTTINRLTYLTMKEVEKLQEDSNQDPSVEDH